MSKTLTICSAIALVLSASVSATAFITRPESSSISQGEQAAPSSAGSMSIWEAYAKGLATIQQVEVDPYDPSGFKVTNFASVPVVVDEKVMLLSPHPFDSGIGVTTQDGSLTEWTIPAANSAIFNYALTVIVPPPMRPEPKWWCMEHHQVVQAGPYIRLGGEIMPFAMADMADNWTTRHQDWYGDSTQDDLWAYMDQHPTLVVGKTPLWKYLPDVAGTPVDITIAVTNLGVYNSSLSDGSIVKAVDSLVKETIPNGYSFDPTSFSPKPDSIVNNSDGSKTVTWKVTIPGADVGWKDYYTPSPYPHVLLKYRLMLPQLSLGRHYLPRVNVDTNHDGANDAHSAKPILDIYHVNVPPTPDAGGPYVAAEGTAIQFDGSKSKDPDGGPSNLTFRWDFENDGVWDTPWSTNPMASHTWGDDFKGTAKLGVSDGDATATAVADVTVVNVLPSGTISLSKPQHEGSPIQFSAHVTDPGSDDLFFKWIWGYGAPDEFSTYYNNGMSPDPYPSPDINPRDVTDAKSHTYGDNGAFTVTVLVTDDDSGTTGTTLTITATPDNLPPEVRVTGYMNIDEGQSVTLTAPATDPGSDDLTFVWSWGDGSSDTKTYYNNGVSPDPPNSPGGNYPFTVTDTRTHPYGDNGVYGVTLTVKDDDGGSVTWSGQVVVDNLPPIITLFGPFMVDEGSPLVVNTTVSDPGSDDLTFEWIFELGPTTVNVFYNDGVGPDPPNSPGGTYPFTIFDEVQHTYGDNGDFMIQLKVTDDDGFTSTHTTDVGVLNLAPTITPFGPYDVNEADPIAFDASAVDAGSDDLTFSWTFEYGTTPQHVFYNDGTGPDPAKSPDGLFPFSVVDSVSHTYGDDGVFAVRLVVQDDDGGVSTYGTTVTVHNLPPTVLDAKVFTLADVSIRVAGEKWHDVILRLFDEGREIGWVQVIRYPGSPDDQMATLHGVEITLGGTFSAVVYYTPDDDPVNGQPNGANPVWLILDWENGNETRIHHTFNVQHDSTWVWMVDNLHIYAVNQRIHFRATATDPGSDDLTFVWETGDGRRLTGVYYNNGRDPDPYPSPDVNPITATDEQVVIYPVAGTYAITLTVTDDDGGAATFSTTILIGG